MAKTETKTIERTYTIPLRKEYSKVPRQKRTKKAVTAVKKFLQKHMKSEQVKLGKNLNEELWKHGIRNPPHHIKITTIKDEKGVVKAELFGHQIETKKKEEKKPSKLQEIAKKAGVKMPAKKEKEVKPKEKTETPKVSAGNKGGDKSPEIEEKKEEVKPKVKEEKSKETQKE